MKAWHPKLHVGLACVSASLILSACTTTTNAVATSPSPRPAVISGPETLLGDSSGIIGPHVFGGGPLGTGIPGSEIGNAGSGVLAGGTASVGPDMMSSDFADR